MKTALATLCAYLIALPVFILYAARATSDVQTFTLSATLTTDTAGLLQVFYDIGRGFREEQSFVAPMPGSKAPREYKWRLETRRFQGFRLDPGTAPGNYILHRLAILDAAGNPVAIIPPDQFASTSQVEVVSRSRDGLVLRTNGGDASVVYTASIDLARGIRAGWRAALPALFCTWAGAAALLLAIARRSRSTAPPREPNLIIPDALGTRRKAALVLAAAVGSTALAMYPVLFVGRSLVSPNNGEHAMLYGTAPFLPGSTDTKVDRGRGSDTAATMWAFVPYSSVQRRALSDFEVPLWNRYNGGGRPLWGQGQSFLLDPLHWLALITPDLAWGFDLKLFSHRAIFSAGIGLAALRVTTNALPATLVAASAPFIGLYAFRMNHPAAFTVTYAPWLFLAFVAFAQAAHARARVLTRASIVATTCLIMWAAPPKEAVAALGVTWLAGTLAVLRTPSSWGYAERLASLAGCGSLAALITAPHWIVFVRTLKQTATPYDTPAALFADLPFTVSLFLGPVAPGHLLPGLHALALVLLVAACVELRRLLRDPALIGAAAATAVSVAIAFGLIPSALITRIPFAAHIVHVHDVFLTAAFPLMLVLSAAGADVLLSRRPHGMLVAALTALIGWRILIRTQFLASPVGLEPVLAFAVLSAAVSLPLLAALRFRGNPRIIAAAAGLAVAITLLPAGFHLETGLPRLDDLLAQPRVRPRLEERSPAVDAAGSGEPTRVGAIGWSLFPGSQGLYGVEGIGGPDALALPLYDDLLNAAGVWRGWTWVTLIPPEYAVRLAPTLDMLNVTYLLNPMGEHTVDTEDIPLAQPDRLRVERRPTAWPRAFFLDGVSRYGGLDELIAAIGTQRRPAARIQSSDGGAVRATEGIKDPATTIVPASDYGLQINSTRFHIRAPSRGVAVLTESYLAGEFRVTLNGERADYFRVNHAFKGVVIPRAGEWDVVFEYQPKYWRTSLTAAGIGILLLIVWSLAGMRRRMRDHAAPADPYRPTP